MALIYRSIFEISSESFVSEAPGLFEAWLARKLRTGDLAAVRESFGDRVSLQDVDIEFSFTSDGDGTVAAFRGTCFEDRRDEEVRLTFTALTDGTKSWAWTDVQRWTSDVHADAWIPYAPALVRQLIEHYGAFVGDLRLPAAVEQLDPEQAQAFADLVAAPERTLPIVVVSPTHQEREGDMRACHERARELQAQLGGIARVAVLGPGATSAFSERILRHAGTDMDVHSGSIRTYLPGVGDADDRPFRHRVVPFQRIKGRPVRSIGRLVALPLQRAACLLPPPAVWREQVMQLPAFSRDIGEDLTVMNEVLEIAERERDEADEQVAAMRAQLEDEQETVAEVLGQLDVLTRRVQYLEAQLTELAPETTYEQPAELDPFDAEWCADVVQHAAERLDLLEFGDAVPDAAEALDAHMNRSWARKAWRAFQALQAYAEHKRDRTNGGGDFRSYCEQAADARVIPRTWVATGESEITDNTERFRRQRVLPVSQSVDASGEIYMPAHVRIEKGGTPCPRIHFYDDTAGPTRKIHIGWFGDHLDSRAKS